MSLETLQPWELKNKDFVAAFPGYLVSFLQLPSAAHGNTVRRIVAQKTHVERLYSEGIITHARKMIQNSLHRNPSIARQIAQETLHSISMSLSLHTAHDLQAMRILLLGDLGTIHKALSDATLQSRGSGNDARALVEKYAAVHYFMNADIETGAMTAHAYPIMTAFRTLDHSEIGTAISALYNETPGSREQYGTANAARNLAQTINLPSPELFNF